MVLKDYSVQITVPHKSSLDDDILSDTSVMNKNHRIRYSNYGIIGKYGLNYGENAVESSLLEYSIKCKLVFVFIRYFDRVH